MTQDPDPDHQLDALLAGLPHETASADLIPAVLARVAPRPRRLTLGLAALAAAIALALTLVSHPNRSREQPSPGVDPSQLEALTQQYRQLASELETLELLRAAGRPIVYVGSTGRADIVLDLERLARRRKNQGTGMAPATFLPGDPQP